MARPQSHSRDEFIAAALSIVDSDGLGALTFRRLGSATSTSFTTAYTYFKNRDELISALVDEVLKNALQPTSVEDDSPYAKILALCLSLRGALVENPARAELLVSLATDVGDRGNEALLTVVGLLEDAGLSGKQLTLAYRVIESYVLGATTFDLGAAPSHLAVRKSRYALSRHAAFLDLARSQKSVEAHNEEAFRYGLEGLLAVFGLAK